jgi:hypothetical protein
MSKVNTYPVAHSNVTEHQIAQVHSLGILQKDIRAIADSYGPYDTKHVTKLNTENAVIANNDVINNYKYFIFIVVSGLLVFKDNKPGS